MKKTFITEFDMFSDCFEEYRIPVLVAEESDLNKTKSICLNIIDKLNMGWTEPFIMKMYTYKYEEEFLGLNNSDFPLLICKKSLEKYQLKYLLKLAVECLDEEIEKGNELIKMKIAPK